MTVDREKPVGEQFLREVCVLGGGRDRPLGGSYERRGIAPYQVYQLQFRFSATTLTLLFMVYVVVPLVTLVFLGSIS